MSDIRNYVLLGEAGCGKSELAINLARRLLDTGKPVDLFDLDMTKPLFRTREQADRLADMGIRFHFEEQFADAPTVGGGVMRALKDTDSYTVLDVGGDYIGARAIGGYAPLLNREDTEVLYIINPFRPWSTTADRAGLVLSQVLGVSHIRPERIRLVGNPNLGSATTAEVVLEGYQRLTELVERLDGLCVEQSLCETVQASVPVPVFPIERYLEYPWNL